MKYIVHCGDVHQVFAYDSTWTDTALRRRLEQLVRKVEIAPGLLLLDENKKLWKLRISVDLEPAQ